MYSLSEWLPVTYQDSAGSLYTIVNPAFCQVPPQNRLEIKVGRTEGVRDGVSQLSSANDQTQDPLPRDRSIHATIDGVFAIVTEHKILIVTAFHELLR